jgi:ATP-dependent RNA helicase DeaD
VLLTVSAAAACPPSLLSASGEPGFDEPGFDQLGLPPGLLAAVRSAGFVTPTPIQAAAIPALLRGRDVVGLAPTGTGKTAAFALPILAEVRPDDRQVQALVLTPTRELALQVATAIERLADDGVRVAAIYGGAPIGPQVGALRRGCQIVVGTPGRIIDHQGRGTLDLGAVSTVVLDEADEMLRMGFAEDIDLILTALPATRRTALFSATMPPAIRAIAARHLNHPLDVRVDAPTMAASSVTQQYAVVPAPERTPALVRVLSTRDSGATIVFVRTRAGCQELGAELAAQGIAAAAISGDIAQAERERIIERLRDGRLSVLVATDVAARGLDVDRIDHVVNVGVPNDAESYVHRIGRTGRAGRSGLALTLVTPREIGRIRTIERVTGVRMTEVVPPSAADVVAHRSAAVLRTAIGRLRAGELDRHRQEVAGLVDGEGVDALDLAAALLALAGGDYPSAQAAAPVPTAARSASIEAADRSIRAATRPDRRRATADPGARTTADAGLRTSPIYRIDVGRSHGVRPAAIVGAITGEGGMTGKDVGRIDIYDTYSTVEITGEVTPVAWDRISRAKVSGRPLRLRRDRAIHESGPARAGEPGPARAGASGFARIGASGPARTGDRRRTGDGPRRLKTVPAGPRRRG